jgi:hypothetical protein
VHRQRFGPAERTCEVEGSESDTHRLPPAPAYHHPADMFVVSEAEATAIRTAFDQGGEFAAAVELRRLFPAVTDNAEAQECARAIATWKPRPVRPRQWTRRDPGRNRR